MNIENQLQLQFTFKNWLAGTEFLYNKPKYNQFATTSADIYNEEDEVLFKEYFLRYESEHFSITGGTYETAFGTGMILHNYYDADFDIDSSLMGLLSTVSFDKFEGKVLFGQMESSEIDYQKKNEDDQIGALDGIYFIGEKFKLGGSFVLHRINKKLDENLDYDYLKNMIIGSRLIYQANKMEFTTEYAAGKDDNDLKSHALYTNITSYLGKFTVVGAYKNYRNFDNKIHDLPTVNHSEEPIHESYFPGTNEQGLMGEIRFVPNYENEIQINYAEGWDNDLTVRQSDIYAEYKREFENLSITTEFSRLESWKKDSNWENITTPHLSMDFAIGNFPITLKSEYEIREKVNGQNKDIHYEPKVQLDIAYNDYSISTIMETQINDSEDAEDGDVWVGVEAAVTLFRQTDVRLFVGKEKAGKVCRNGVCKKQPEFDGIRLNITTTF